MNKATRNLIKLFYKVEECLSLQEKIDILKKFPNQADLERIFCLVFSPFTRFGFDSSILREKEQEIAFLKEVDENADKRYKKVLSVLEDVKEGNKKPSEVKDFLVKLLTTRVTREEFEIFKRLIDRKLAIGLNMEVANTLFPGLISFPSKFMLSGEYVPSLRLKFPVYCELNVDGFRIKLTASPKGEAVAFDLHYFTYNKLFKPHLEILSSIAKKINKTVEVDGEVFYKDWSTTNSILISDDDHPEGLAKARELLTYYAMDFIVRGKESTPLKKRKEKVEKFVALCKNAQLTPLVKNTLYTEANSDKEMISTYKKVMKKGYDGIIIKDPLSPYEHKRSSYWLKLKKIETQDVTILAVYPGQGLSCFKCAAILAKPRLGSPFLVKDLSDSQRDFAWTRRNEIIGQVAEIVFRKSTDGSLGEAKFVRMKFNKLPEKP